MNNNNTQSYLENDPDSVAKITRLKQIEEFYYQALS